MGNERIVDKNILIAVDESENSKMALLYVADFLGGFPGFRPTVLSVLSIPEDDYFETSQKKEKWVESNKTNITKMLDRYKQILVQSGFPEEKVTAELVTTTEEPTSSVILNKQEEYNACTLVIGRRGKSRHEEFLFGSVANKIVHKANRCAVWVIEPLCTTSYKDSP
jgi:nucleotide-binding universal stress UspA family protein